MKKIIEIQHGDWAEDIGKKILEMVMKSRGRVTTNEYHHAEEQATVIVEVIENDKP